MAFQGHPILADIRAGFRLKPTLTVDKSAPIIQADGEDTPTVKYEEPKEMPTIDYALLCPKTERPRVTSTCRVPTEALNIRSRAAPPTGPPPPPNAPRAPVGKPITNPALLKLGKAVGNVDRSALLNSIKGGIKLRKAVTNDKSGLILDDEYLAEIGKPTSDEKNPNETAEEPKVNGHARQTSPPKSPPLLRSPPVKHKSPPRSAGARTAPTPAPLKPLTAGVIPPPPPPPPPSFSRVSNVPPPPPAMPSVSAAKPTPAREPRPSYRPPPVREPEEPKKSDAVFDEKDLHVTRERLQAEIPRGSAAARIAMLKQMEQQTNGSVPMPKALPGRLKIIETTPPDAPRSNGRLKIHDGQPVSSTAAENGKSKVADVTKKFNVPITVKTDDEPTITTANSPVRRKTSKTGDKKKITIKKSTLSPTSAQDSPVSPSSTARSSAYASAASSPTSLSSLSPKSKSSGVSSAASSVSPPVRTSEGAAERFRELRRSLDERVAAAEAESGAQFWKSSLKSNGTTTDLKPTSKPVEIKMPWKPKTTSTDSSTTKVPPAVPKKRTPSVAIRVANYPTNGFHHDPIGLRERFRFEFDIRSDRPLKLVQR